jgi:flagellar basal-body rod protein FlgB
MVSLPGKFCRDHTRQRMDFTRIPLLTLLTKKMGWLQQRQAVLSQNVANGDTPGYQAKDLQAFSFQKELAGASSRMAAKRTDASHLGGSGAGSRRAEVAADKYEASPQGNTVVLEEEMLKISDTQLDHSMIANLYRKQIGMLKMALGGRS